MPGGRAKRHHNLPAHRVRLIGREHDLEVARRALLSSEGRLLTLTGTGGCGKTRLALELASDVAADFGDGVWLIELAAVADPALVPAALVSALSIPERPGESLAATLVNALSACELLLVLDNCEHVIDATAELVEDLLDHAPRLRVLATSREPLRVTGETTWRVPSLGVPDQQAGGADVLLSPAVQLFIERAQANLPELSLTPRMVSVVGQICSRLEGLPLAIELAAARVQMLGLEQILERLDDSVRLLVGGKRTASTRQQTLRATLDWSHQLLGDEEQAVFRRLAVFADSCGLDAVEAVCVANIVEPGSTLDVLQRLVDKSLVLVLERGGDVRYRLLEPVRQYAMEHLVASGEHDSVRRRHALDVAAFVDARNIDTNKGGPRRLAATAELSAEYPNIQAALAWSMESEETQLALRLAANLLFLWQMRGSMGEGLTWLRRCLTLPGAAQPTPARAAAVIAAAYLAMRCGEVDAGRAYCEEGLLLAEQFGDSLLEFLALLFSAVDRHIASDPATADDYARQAWASARASGDQVGEASALCARAMIACQQEDYTTAQPLAEEALRLAQLSQDIWIEGYAYHRVGWAALGLGELQRARVALEAGLAVARRQGEPPVLTQEIFASLGEVALALGQPRQARAWLLDSLDMRSEAGDRPEVAQTFDMLAALAVSRGQSERALLLAGAADAVYESFEGRRSKSDCVKLDRWLGPLRVAFGEEPADRARAQGRAMMLDEAIALARALADDEDDESGKKPPTTAAPHTTTASLTSRELEVALLLARGLSNPQIAAELTISFHTAARHVENILRKLGFSSRTQVAIWAVGQGLIKAETVHASA